MILFTRTSPKRVCWVTALHTGIPSTRLTTERTNLQGNPVDWVSGRWLRGGIKRERRDQKLQAQGWWSNCGARAVVASVSQPMAAIPSPSCARSQRRAVAVLDHEATCGWREPPSWASTVFCPSSSPAHENLFFHDLTSWSLLSSHHYDDLKWMAHQALCVQTPCANNEAPTAPSHMSSTIRSNTCTMMVDDQSDPMSVLTPASYSRLGDIMRAGPRHDDHPCGTS